MPDNINIAVGHTGLSLCNPHHVQDITAVLWPVVLTSPADNDNTCDIGFFFPRSELPPRRRQSLRAGVLATWARPACLSF